MVGEERLGGGQGVGGGRESVEIGVSGPSSDLHREPKANLRFQCLH